MEYFDNVNFEEPGEWPGLLKLLTAVLICIAVWGAGYYFIISDKNIELTKLEQKELSLKKEYEDKYAKAINLAAYREQLQEMRVMFASLLKQLPRKSEVADLLVDISRTGLVNGLEFELFRPEDERPVDFYAELPISMKVIGSYHQLGRFVSGLAALPRIVTIHNLILRQDDTDGLAMEISAKTYRYFDSADEDEANGDG
jgi:type IV pilus assembly protein PilO